MDNHKMLIDQERNSPPEKLDGKELLKSFSLGLATAVALGLGGFFLVYDRTGSMGWVLFLVLPVATGVAIALGALLGSLVRIQVLPRFRKPGIPMMLLLLVLPLFLMGANSAETESR